MGKSLSILGMAICQKEWYSIYDKKTMENSLYMEVKKNGINS